jgi:hypothetical protein
VDPVPDPLLLRKIWQRRESNPDQNHGVFFNPYVLPQTAFSSAVSHCNVNRRKETPPGSNKQELFNMNATLLIKDFLRRGHGKKPKAGIKGVRNKTKKSCRKLAYFLG